jgi:hypothetical protein
MNGLMMITRSPSRLSSAVRSLALVVIVGAASPLRAQECATGATFTGPITITVGGTYTGNWRSQNPSTPAVNVATTQPVTIVNSRVMGPGDLVFAGTRINLTIRESCFVGTNPNVAGQAKGHAVHTHQAARVVIEHCDFDGVGGYGIWIQQYLGDFSPDNPIGLRYNRFHNVDGRASDGRGGYLTASTDLKPHAIILQDVNGLPGIEIAWNQIVNEPYESRVEDSINIYDSSGTRAAPMQIHNNYIQGGWPADPANGAAYTGAAFVTDGRFQTDPALTTGFLKVHDNHAVGFGNTGLAIALGHDIEVYANRAFSSGQLAGGANYSTPYGGGILHFNYQNNPPGVFGNNSVHDNVSGFRRSRNGAWERADYYFGAPAAIAGNNTPWIAATAIAPTRVDEAGELLLWNQKLAAAGVTVGSHFVVWPPSGIPAPPSGVTASASLASVTLGWTGPSSGPAPTAYVIEAGSLSGLADLATFSTGSTSTTFSATGVPAGTYFLRVRAANASGSSTWSNEVGLVVGGSACIAAPGAPTGLVFAAIGGGTLALAWNAAAGKPISYILEAGASPGAANLANTDLGSVATTFRAAGVGRGAYYLRVRARNTCGASPPSNEISVTVP